MTRPPGARWSSPAILCASQARSVTSKTSWRRFDAVSSGPKRRKLDGLSRITSRRNAPSTFVASRSVVPGAVHPHRVRRPVGELEVTQERAAVGVG